MKMNDIVAQEPSNVFDLVKQQEIFFNQVLDSDVVTWQKESQFAIQHLQKNKFLADTAWGNQVSLQNAIINVASIGISLNPASKHAYLVPRDKMVCLDVSYMGMLHLAMQSGAIEWGQAKLVYQNDKYLNNGVDKAPTHSQNTFGDKGDIIGAYCTVKLPNGDFLTEEMDVEALNKVKASSKAAKGPWSTWPEEMMRKTVVKRASKYWPSCERLHKAIDVVNEHEGFVEEPDYTEEDKTVFDGLISTKNSFGMCAFMATASPEMQQGLFGSFKKGEISSNKDLVRKLQSEGFLSWETFLQDLRALIAEGDSIGILGEIEEFEIYEKQHLKTMLGDDFDTFKKLLDAAQ
jgi:recombination protein RecT